MATNNAPNPGRYTAQLTPNGTPLPANVQPWREVSGFAEGARQFAEGLESAGMFEVRRQIEEGEAQQTWWLTQRNAEDEIEAQELLTTAIQNVQAGGKIQPLLTAEWQKRATDKLATVTDPRLRQAYMQQLGRISEGIATKAKAFDVEESFRYTKELFTSAVDNKAKYYGTLGYDEVDGQAQLDFGELISKIESTPATPEQKAEMRKTALENLTNAANMRKIMLDPIRYLVGQATALPAEIRQGDPSLPRGIRNNNPGNLKAGDSWKGATGQDDAGYATFESPEMGLRAMAINLRNQQKLHGLNTVQDIISKYAPSSENPTAAYITQVSQALGVAPDEAIDLKDPDTLATMMGAMIKVENGDNPYAPEEIARAAGMEGVPTVTPKLAEDGTPLPMRTRSNAVSWNQGTFEQQQKWIQLAIAQRNAVVKEKTKLDAVRKAEVTSDMEILLNRGEITYADIDAAYTRGDLSPEKRTSFYKILDERNSMDAKSRDAMGRVALAVEGVAMLDPKNADDKKAVDEHFQASVQSLAQQPGATPEQVQGRSLALVKSYGMVPQSLQGQVRAQLRSSNAQDITAGVDMLVKLREINPELLNDFSSEDIKGANHIASLVQAGFTPEQAVLRASEALKITPEIRDAREQAYKQAQTDDAKNTAAEQIKTQFNSMWRSDPADIPIEMQTDFDSLARTEYVRTGNMAAAQRTASDFIRRTWATTSIGFGANGEKKRWMKNPPEKFYAAPVAGVDNSEWMREQLIDDLNEADKLSGTDYEEAQVMLSPARIPAPDGRPQYVVSYKDINGVIQIYGGENGAFLWRPDWEKSNYRKRMLDRERQREKQKNVGPIIMRGGF